MVTEASGLCKAQTPPTEATFPREPSTGSGPSDLAVESWLEQPKAPAERMSEVRRWLQKRKHLTKAFLLPLVRALTPGPSKDRTSAFFQRDTHLVVHSDSNPIVSIDRCRSENWYLSHWTKLELCLRSANSDCQRSRDRSSWLLAQMIVRDAAYRRRRDCVRTS